MNLEAEAFLSANSSVCMIYQMGPGKRYCQALALLGAALLPFSGHRLCLICGSMWMSVQNYGWKWQNQQDAHLGTSYFGAVMEQNAGDKEAVYTSVWRARWNSWGRHRISLYECKRKFPTARFLISFSETHAVA